jgi:type IV pilus assembly protein PilV
MSAYVTPSPARAQSGFSMIEVLVALLIFAFGMLGLAGLQSRTLAFSQTSLYRSQATALTDDILDRIRLDRTNASSGSWNTDFPDTASTITGTQLYKVEMKDWKQQVEELLPSGAAKVVVDGSGIVTVTLQWDESRAEGSALTQKFETTSRL